MSFVTQLRQACSRNSARKAGGLTANVAGKKPRRETLAFECPKVAEILVIAGLEFFYRHFAGCHTIADRAERRLRH